MTEAALVTRQELAALAGMPPGTFWCYVLQYNKKAELNGWPKLEPDEVQELRANGKALKFMFKPERVGEFKAALARRKEKTV